MPDVTITRAELVEVMRAATEAAGNPAATVLDCPHTPGSSDPNERVRAGAWVRAFLRARGVVD